VLTNSCHTLRHRALLAVPTAAVVAALMGSSLATATPMPTSPAGAPAPTGSAPATQGIIMRDGGVCDPIRHMGC
jgi:hypothetical protein